MKYRQLGNTGLRVSEIGFGAWGIGGLTENITSYGPTNDQQSKNALSRAYEMGINFYDTSNIYGNGHSEELLGQVFKKNRDKVIIATKAGFPKHLGAQDFSPDYLRGSLEESLKRLQTDYVDLFQLHSPDVETIRRDKQIIEILKSLLKEGKIRSYGISVQSPNDGLIAIQEFGFPVIQTNINMVDQRSLENGLLDLAKKSNVGIIARTPLCFGFLTGKYNKNNLHASDHRNAYSDEQLKNWEEAPNLFSSLIDGGKRTFAQLALQFCLAQDVSTTIPGILTEQHANENALSSGLTPLTANELSYITKIYKNNTFFIKK